MPRRNDIKKILVIGSGPIIIGQAAEFDYAGTQACRALHEEGYEVVLINSNPATIMTDKTMADHIYIEPLVPEVVKAIIRKERPDAMLPTLGGQIGLNLAMELYDEGFLDEMHITLLGCKPDSIKNAEDRQRFKDICERIGQPLVPSLVVNNTDDALSFAALIGYPVIVRPAYTMGGTGGGMADDPDTLRRVCEGGLAASRVGQALIEKNIAGWKEIEYEVMRDHTGNVITICSMENVDPVGVHTGDSIVIAPAQTMNEAEHAMMHTAAVALISALDIEGGCNVQFALHPESMEYAVIEVNPRLSRSSALASKATGFPIARVATKIAVGYGLDEIPNRMVDGTYACFEPAIDYVVIKYPRFPFDKFVHANRTLGPQMKATGEVMSLGLTFESALMKAVRSAELGLDTLRMPSLSTLSPRELRERLAQCTDERLFIIAELLARNVSDVEHLHQDTGIDRFFLHGIRRLMDMEGRLRRETLSEEFCRAARHLGYTNTAIARLSGQSVAGMGGTPVYRKVDTCAGMKPAAACYYYSTDGEGTEAFPSRNRRRVLVLGAGPIRIGQGIEFDYCTVHCVWALQQAGCEAIIVNNNPETVSTDFDTSDKLYFEPLTPEDVQNIIDVEQPEGVIVQFGGQTAIKLATYLDRQNIPIFGTPAWSVDAAEDREKFDAILTETDIPRPQGAMVFTADEAVEAGNRLGYPVLVRPSYVLGGQGMEIAYCDADIRNYMEIICRVEQEHPILVDKYMMGREIEVDAICDGEDILIPGIMEHLERAGVHSGDSISVYPPLSLEPRHIRVICEYTRRLAQALSVKGLVNIQFVLYNDEIYVIEVNPRSSRTVPYISKVTGVPMVALATRCLLGEKLRNMNCGTGLHPVGDYVAVKVPVFSFSKLHDVDTQLGPEMKSTGEVLGLAENFREALFKGFAAAGMTMKKKGAVLITVRDADKQEILRVADRFDALGFALYATAGTAAVLRHNMIAANTVRKMHEESPTISDLIRNGSVDYVVCTSSHGSMPQQDDVRLRRLAVERGIPCLTSVDTASALLRCLESNLKLSDCEMLDINARL